IQGGLAKGGRAAYKLDFVAARYKFSKWISNHLVPKSSRKNTIAVSFWQKLCKLLSHYLRIQLLSCRNPHQRLLI
ncbi:MAG: hypothetical protein AAFP02_26210, partial [Bacteroidota bacterium]